MDESIILYSKRGRPRLFTPEQQAEKFRVYMRKYMKMRFDEEKALRPPKEPKQTKGFFLSTSSNCKPFLEINCHPLKSMCECKSSSQAL